MTFNNNFTEFAGKPVEDWEPGTGIADPAGRHYRIALTWDESEEGGSWLDKFAAFLEDPRVPEITGLVVGAWENVPVGNGVQPIVEAIVAAHDRLPRLTALFLGDITYEESEVSWIRQGDVSPLFTAYPALEQFGVRGGNDLRFGRLRHARLKSLVIESGGLPAEAVREVAAAELPALEHLELYLGTPEYGGNATVEDLEPLLEGTRFPRLTYLGLRDSEIADQIATAVATAPILQRIQVLDLSLGTLGDEGAQALLDSPAVRKLRKLDLHHHYMTPEIIERFEHLGIEVDVSESNDPDEDFRYAAVAE